MNAWTDARIDDFMTRYREDRDQMNATLVRIETKVDAKTWSPSLLIALLTPMGAALIGALALILTKGG